MVDSKAISLVVYPVALVDVTVDMGELAFTVGSVVAPLAFVFGAVGPDLNALAIPKSALPLTLISSTSLESIEWSLLPSSIWIIDTILRNCFSRFIQSKIPRVRPFRFEDEGCVAASHVTSEESLELDDDMNVVSQPVEILTTTVVCLSNCFLAVTTICSRGCLLSVGVLNN